MRDKLVRLQPHHMSSSLCLFIWFFNPVLAGVRLATRYWHCLYDLDISIKVIRV
jgi:hypothetical protein